MPSGFIRTINKSDYYSPQSPLPFLFLSPLLKPRDNEDDDEVKVVPTFEATLVVPKPQGTTKDIKAQTSLNQLQVAYTIREIRSQVMKNPSRSLLMQKANSSPLSHTGPEAPQGEDQAREGRQPRQVQEQGGQGQGEGEGGDPQDPQADQEEERREGGVRPRHGQEEAQVLRTAGKATNFNHLLYYNLCKMYNKEAIQPNSDLSTKYDCLSELNLAAYSSTYLHVAPSSLRRLLLAKRPTPIIHERKKRANSGKSKPRKGKRSLRSITEAQRPIRPFSHSTPKNPGQVGNPLKLSEERPEAFFARLNH